MNFQIASDIHIKYFGDIGDDFFIPQASTLVLLGDICEFSQLHACYRIFERMGEKWDHILYVFGNHEYYGATLSDRVITYAKKLFSPIPNITVLNRDTIIIEDTCFIGTTLWSDMLNGNPIAESVCSTSIADYSYIKVSDPKGFTRRLLTLDTIKEFKRSLKFIKKAVSDVSDNHKAVVLTHHAPSFMSVTDKYRGSLMNGAFVSELTPYIMDNPKISVWAHGHVHSDHDYKIGSTRVVCHPLGYWGEVYEDTTSYKPMLIEN